MQFMQNFKDNFSYIAICMYKINNDKDITIGAMNEIRKDFILFL